MFFRLSFINFDLGSKVLHKRYYSFSGKKLRFLPNLPDDIILCYVDIVGLYPNIPHDKGLPALGKRLDLRKEKDVTTSTLVELTEVVLKINTFPFKEKNLKQKRGTAIDKKFGPPSSYCL